MKGGGLALVGGRIESNTEGVGNGGLIDLRLTDSIEIEGIQDLNRADLKVPSGDEGVITSQSKAGGSGGKIKIEADKLLSKAGAAILADARETVMGARLRSKLESWIWMGQLLVIVLGTGVFFWKIYHRYGLQRLALEKEG